MAITLTAQAAQRVEKYLAQRGKGVGVRLGVRPADVQAWRIH